VNALEVFDAEHADQVDQAAHTLEPAELANLIDDAEARGDAGDVAFWTQALHLQRHYLREGVA